VARALARQVGGVFNTVLILIDPDGEQDLTDELRAAVNKHLETVRMAGREVVLSPPNYVPLDVQLAVCPETGSEPATVRETVYAALRPGTDARPGFFHPNRLFFGEEIDLPQVLSVVQALPGVRSVKATKFERLGFPQLDPITGKPLPLKKIVLAPPEIPRLDADENAPENGRLEVLMVGTDPEVDVAQFKILTNPVTSSVSAGSGQG
jgi:hypothetical protein